ncbi:hypothetical protein [Curtobacterium sp. MCJR17_020]|uniref:hypothetical protein n=1 Tax=Curtobacterium sp. MCJR17_020 TaxID=2175619 RepID=UPI0021ABF93D|nr:hypothetical protein [Curtobacterium sp. MCJR17_020]WIE74098.1 hypothetical protein DEJ14_019270 [Curtobacterium sp. MCJR17_020]
MFTGTVDANPVTYVVVVPATQVPELLGADVVVHPPTVSTYTLYASVDTSVAFPAVAADDNDTEPPSEPAAARTTSGAATVNPGYIAAASNVNDAAEPDGWSANAAPSVDDCIAKLPAVNDPVPYS